MGEGSVPLHSPCPFIALPSKEACLLRAVSRLARRLARALVLLPASSRSSVGRDRENCQWGEPSHKKALATASAARGGQENWQGVSLLARRLTPRLLLLTCRQENWRQCQSPHEEDRTAASAARMQVGEPPAA